MSNLDLKHLELDESLVQKLSKQNLHTPQDILSLTRVEALKLLGISDKKRAELVKTISMACSPKPSTAFEIYCAKQRRDANFLPLSLEAFDQILHGGLPLGNVTEISGPSGVGKTQFCFMLSVLATLPVTNGGLDGAVIFIDTELTFSPQRLMEIAKYRMPHLYSSKQDLVNLLKKVLVYKASTSEVLKQIFRKLEWDIIRSKVKLIVIDSIASLVRKEFGSSERFSLLVEQAAFLKHLAESLGIVVLVTNQITTQYRVSEVISQSSDTSGSEDDQKIDKEHIIPAQGVTWAHSVNTRLVAQYCGSTERQLLLVKSSLAPYASVSYTIQRSGIVSNADAKILQSSDPQLQSIHTKYKFLGYNA